jgi:hypothetical protein
MSNKSSFSVKHANMKVIDNFVRFPESTRIQESEFVCVIHDQNTKLDRGKSEQGDMM